MPGLFEPLGRGMYSLLRASAPAASSITEAEVLIERTQAATYSIWAVSFSVSKKTANQRFVLGVPVYRAFVCVLNDSCVLCVLYGLFAKSHVC